MEQFDFPTAETKDIISTFLNQSCVLLRNFVDAAALERAYDMTLKAYERIDGYHVHPHHLREFGMPMYSDVLFGRRHFDLLREVFGKREYRNGSRNQRTADGSRFASRRIGCRRSDRISTRSCIPRGTTVNFWVPFQECGVDAPGLGVVQAPFADVRSFASYWDGAKVWDDPAPIGSYMCFRPAMKALHRDHDPKIIANARTFFPGQIATPTFKPGDAMMISNWTLHLTHSMPEMPKTRECELRFWSAAWLEDICASTAFEDCLLSGGGNLVVVTDKS